MKARALRLEEIGDEIASLYAHISAAMARWLGLLGEFDEGAGWVDGGYKSCAHWLSWRCGIDVRTAREHVCVARRLEQRPLIRDAFERGELSYSKVRALLRLEDDFDEELMLQYAQSASASQLERIVRGCRRCVAVEEGSARQFAERDFHWGYDEGGAVVFHGRLPAEVGAVVVRALEAARDELGPPPSETPVGLDPLTAEQSGSVRARNADALVALAATKLAERASSADLYQLVVHVDVDALRGSAEPPGDGSAEPFGDCRLDDGSPLPRAAARRLACDASIVRVLERDGKPISLGRKTRTIAPALRRALHIRQKTCMFPACTQRHHTDAHHVEHWADGGQTDLGNLLRLCRFHHGLVHEGGFDVRRAPRGGFVFHDPHGKVIPQSPRPPRGDCTAIPRVNGRHGADPGAATLYPRDSTGENVDLRWSVMAMLESRSSPGALVLTE